jgi:hypothetical protein
MAKPPQIVEAHDVVGVRMGEDDGIEMTNVFSQNLRPKIRAGIHDKRALRRFDKNRRTRPCVPRIR